MSTSKLEADFDFLVYRLYGLTADEMPSWKTHRNESRVGYQCTKREDFVRFLDSSRDVPPVLGDEL